MQTIHDILQENIERSKKIFATFNPITGEGSVGERTKFVIKDYPIKVQYLPVEMLDEPFVKSLAEYGSVKRLVEKGLKTAFDKDSFDMVVEQFVRIRNKYDFPFWAATFVYIKRKGGGSDLLFKLTRPQRRFVEVLEAKRKANKPIRIILNKARQWGGSTTSQLYMSWLQLVHKVGLNSLIIAHQVSGSDEIKDMFDRMIKRYPVKMLHDLGESYSENEQKMVGVGKSGNIYRIPQRNFKIKIGTAERPNGCLGGDYNLIHMSETSKWKTTEGKKPEDIVDAACSGVLLKPYTMIVIESTPDGVGNYFHREYIAAKNGISQFDALFISWFDIDLYSLDFDSDKEREEFATWLFDNRDNDTMVSDREQPGTYMWWLWELGATLEAIHWYHEERRKYNNHASMASMYPSDDVEAFTFSGRKVFNQEDVKQLEVGCKSPKWIGDIYGRADEGTEAIKNLRFRKEQNGRLKIWQDVEKDEEEIVLDRYLVVVDVCKGHSEKADFSDIIVIDRLMMMDGEPPTIVAEWHGHIDMDKLAWKACQIAAYYNNALLVIESNTLETNNTKGEAEYILTLIHDVYGDQLYARKQSAEDIQQRVPKKFGFHTNMLTKKVVIHNLKTVVRERLYVEREALCLEEYLTYVETDRGGFEAMEGHHDDRLMTRAIGMQICYHEMDIPRVVQRTYFNSSYSSKTVSEATI